VSFPSDPERAGGRASRRGANTKNGTDMNEWKEVVISDYIDLISGFAFKSANFTDEQRENTLPVVKIKNVANGDVHLDNIVYHKYDESLSKYVLSKGDVLIAMTGNHPQAQTQVVGDVSKYKLEVNSLLNQRVGKFVSKSNTDLDFIYYLFKSEDVRSYLANKSSGSANQANISKGDILGLNLLLPSLSEQKAIASILSSLDDKIDLLHRQNATLEKMAETLFRQWFVEEAKEDWEETTLGNWVTMYNGVSYKSDDLNPSDTAMVTLKSFDRNGGFRLDGFKEFTGNYKQQHLIQEGDITVAHTDITQDAAVIGNSVLVISDPRYKQLVFSMDLVKVEPKDKILPKEYLYLLMRTPAFKEHCLGYSNGSTVLHLSKKAIPDFEFRMPPIGLIQKFNTIVKTFIDKQFRNITQIRTLTTLRDTLLPKLMSGEVRVGH